MILRRVVGALVMGVLFAAVAAAAVCPLCLEVIPEGQKYCGRHQAEITAKTLSVAKEQKLADVVTKTRSDYRESLNTLLQYYRDAGNAEGYRKVEDEIRNLDLGPQFAFTNWEDALPELVAADDVVEADILLADGIAMRKKFNPFNEGGRIREAAAKFQDILIKYPRSTAVEPAAYALGEIYSGARVKEYQRAAKLFDLCYRSNPKTTRDALYQAALIYDNKLADYEKAAKYYWLTSQTSKSTLQCTKSELRLAALQKRGFGASYKNVEQPKEAEAK